MRRTLRYLFSAGFCLLLAIPFWAQEGRVRGPRIGYDAGALTLLYFEPDRHLHTFSIDYELKQDIYPAIEFGWQNVNIDKKEYRYFSDGLFARIGADINLFKYDNPVDYDMGYAGVRYGFAHMRHSASNILIEEAYWGDLMGGELVERWINAHWLSIGGGLRTEVFHNFFMGWSLFANFKLAQVKDTNMDPFNVPGFGSGSKKVTLTINYSLYFRIPLFKYP